MLILMRKQRKNSVAFIFYLSKIVIVRKLKEGAMALDIKKSVGKLSSKIKNIGKFKKFFSNTKNKKLFKTPKFIISTIVALLVVFLSVMSVGIYKYGWDNNFTKNVVTVVPFPAAIVNGKGVFYYDYIQQVSMLKKYQADFKGVDFNTDEGKATLKEIQTEVMNSLIQTSLIQVEAKKDKVVLSNQELNDSYNDLIESNGGEASFTETLSKYYGLTPKEFKNGIYKKSLLTQKLNEKFSTDESLNADAKKKAEEVLAKVKAGEDFATLAKENSEDTTAANGGDLGLFSKGTMLQEFEDVAFALKVGETSGLVKTIYGYHIIKVTEISGEQVKASHILIKTKDLEAWLTDAVASAKLNVFLRMEPFLTEYVASY
jgi:foldase protein PrsA